MPLLINDLVFDENYLARIYEFYPSLKETCDDFLSKPIQLINSPKFLFVSQGEYCIIDKNDDNIDYVGSDEATTCCLMFLESDSSYAIAHLDNSIKLASLKQLINELLNCNTASVRTAGDHLVGNPKLECKLIGSYNDEAQYSLKFLFKFLMNLNKISNVDIHLSLACILEKNTKIIEKNDGQQFNCPKFYGAAVNLQQQPSQINPAEFEERGPAIILRRARRTCQSKDLTQVYNSATKLFVINEYQYFRISQLDQLMSADDQFILDHFSTSPACEPAHFANSIRQVFALMNNGKAVEPTHRFRRDENGNWIEI